MWRVHACYVASHAALRHGQGALKHVDLSDCACIIKICLYSIASCLEQQEHPDTVGGAMLTGVREAVRVLRMLKGDTEEEANAAAGAVDAGLPSRKRKQVCLCCLSCCLLLPFQLYCQLDPSLGKL